ncbi:hypothetical protein CLOP_g22370, partial [Closterium sp. NIES-67]
LVDSQSLQIERLFSENSGLAAGLKEVSAIAARWEAQVRAWQQLQSEQQQADSSKEAAASSSTPGAAAAASSTAATASTAGVPGGSGGELLGGMSAAAAAGAGGGAAAAAAVGPGLGDTDTEADMDDQELPVSTSPRQHLELPPLSASGSLANGERKVEVVALLGGDALVVGAGVVEGGEAGAGEGDGERKEVGAGARGGEDGGEGQGRGAGVEAKGGDSVGSLREENRKLKDELSAAQHRIRQLSVQSLRSSASCTTAVQRLSQTKRLYGPLLNSIEQKLLQYKQETPANGHL